MLHKTLLLLSIFFMVVVCSSVVSANAKDVLETNLNMGVGDIILFLCACGIIVMTAFDVRVALMFAFLLFMSLFIIFYSATELGYSGFDPYHVGIAMMLCFVIMALMLLVTYKKANTYGGIR